MTGLAMMTDDVIFEASFGKDPWGTPRGSGRYETHGCAILSLRDGKISAKRSYRKASL